MVTERIRKITITDSDSIAMEFTGKEDLYVNNN